MKTTKACILAIAGSVASSQASIIAYEGFDTASANGTDATAVGVTGSGFSGYGNTNFRMDIEDGLSYADSSGNTLVVTGKSAGKDASVGGTQNLQLTLTSTIVNTGTIYMSFLVNTTAGTSWGLATGLSTAEVGDSASPSTIAASLRSTSSNFGIYGAGNDIDIRTGPDSTPAGLSTIFFVAELNMTTEIMTGYINPTDLNDVSGTAVSTMTDTATGWGDMTHFVHSLGADYTGTVDEIRIGTTMADVTPFTAVPEPSSTALLGLGGIALLLRRRK
ncbi:MAG: PEP-CTERM sorting domain-containing protein [Akkermansiaceae bacterium]|jgi:hypothetical protein